MQLEGSIGFFDSGVGGISIWKEVQELMPYESTIYLADSKNAPYGSRSKKEIIDLSIKNTELLLANNCKLIVVACNTATTNAIDFLRTKYQIPFIGIEPAIKPAALQSSAGVIGVLATRGTLSSSLFHETMSRYTNGVKIIEKVGDGLVPLIEEGKVHSKIMHNLLAQYMKPMIDGKIDYLVLGCTHYPYLIPVLKKILPDHIKIIDSGAAVAKQTKTILEKFSLENVKNIAPKHVFYTNKDAFVLKSFLKDVELDIEVSFKDF
ncbi:glutamate racemase [Ascidiimonas sp. W6]|uniref:glutamate racemase n=1 Tax=Ascidiimonas meishanensis TaxID=3128903 RepID=UPI0030ED902E